uniref:At2g35280-like TPR domain-containing protein n=1 Tax=Solanum tuberosum TaxID=4113 RepID=M1DIB9_SOLTU
MCRVSGNLEALYRKGVYDFFNRSDSNGLGMLSQAADCGHIGASYVLAIVSIFNGGEFMKEGSSIKSLMNLLYIRSMIFSTVAIQMDWECLVKQQTVATLVHPMCLP